MSNHIRQQLLAHGMIRPAIATKGAVRADSKAIEARQHEYVGRKAAKACSIINDAVRRDKREKNEERRDARHWR